MSAKRKTISLDCSLSSSCACSLSSSCGPETPNTPEILNAIINISSDHLATLEATIKTENTTNDNEHTPSNSLCHAPGPAQCHASSSSPVDISRYDFSGQFPSSSAPCAPPTATPAAPPPSVKHYHSQFIKEGLKLKVKQKIKDESLSYGSDDGDSKIEGDLTYEDEERRSRRRERNKIAATKCRNKKKERTTRLIAEGEVLEIQNASLKEELRKLEAEKRSLSDLLTSHQPQCKAKKLKLGSKSRRSGDHCEFRFQDRVNRKEKPGVERLRESPGRLQNNPQINFPNPCQYNSFDVDFHNKNMFIKQETDQCMDYFGQTGGYFHYGFHPSMNKNNIFDGQSLCLSNYPLSGVDTMCLAL